MRRLRARTSTHHSLQLPSRTPSTHTPWSGRGSWRPGGARHCTNDLDARGRVCSALPFCARVLEERRELQELEQKIAGADWAQQDGHALAGDSEREAVTLLAELLEDPLIG
ncbi:hypothetical protein [Streptomyces sp. NPDC001381]|uniref:hypothetical protein n=1 Tax=Streptomyces sp. NPDC001381 TaxID=3364567 RepID=UPI00368E4ACB